MKRRKSDEVPHFGMIGVVQPHDERRRDDEGANASTTPAPPLSKWRQQETSIRVIFRGMVAEYARSRAEKVICTSMLQWARNQWWSCGGPASLTSAAAAAG